MVVSKENMVVFIGVLLFSINLIDSAFAIRSINHVSNKDDVNVVCNPKDLPIVYELRDGAKKYARGYNPIDLCKPLQDG